MNDKIREVAFRVREECGCLDPHYKLTEFLTRCLQELSKDVEPVAWLVMNGLVSYQLFHSCSEAHATAKEMQKRHDLSGSLASFSVQPLYLHPPLTEQDKLDAEQWRAYQKRKQDLLDRGFLKNPLRDEAMEHGKCS